MKLGAIGLRIVIITVIIASSWVAPTRLAPTVQAATCATPSITSIYPNWGGVYSVPETVTIRGCGFTGATGVNFHSGYGSDIPTVIDDSTITVGPPPHVWAPGSFGQGWFEEDVSVTTPGGTSPTTDADEFYWYWSGTPCSMASITGALPATPGGPIVLTAKTFACVSPMYRFWIAPPGGSWRVVQDYTAGTNMVGTYNWTLPAGASGTYRLEVDVRDASRSYVAYDRVASMSYTVGGCIAAGISASPESPSNVGTAVTLTASSDCPGAATYRFWIRPPGGLWSIVQNYGTSNTYAWNTTGLKLGIYGLEVDVRHLGSTAAYEQATTSSYRIGVPCTTPTVSANPPLAATGSSVTLSASTSGCANPVYRFWTKRNGGPWVMVRDYSAINTFNWTTPGTGVAGDYEIEADVRDSSANVPYDAVGGYSARLMGCLFVNLNATTPQPAPFPANGLLVTLTATPNCESTPTYRFWVRAPGGAWHIVQDYSTVNTFVWPVPVSGTYWLEVDVRNQGATSPYEAVANMSYVV